MPGRWFAGAMEWKGCECHFGQGGWSEEASLRSRDLKDLEEGAVEISGGLPGRGNSKCRGPEMGPSQACLNEEEASRAGAE